MAKDYLISLVSAISYIHFHLCWRPIPIPPSLFQIPGPHCQWQFATNILKGTLFHTLWFSTYLQCLPLTPQTEHLEIISLSEDQLIRLWSLIAKAVTTVTRAMVRNFSIEEPNSQCHNFEGQTTSSDVLSASFRLSDHPVAVSSGPNLPWKSRTQSLVISSWFLITKDKPTMAIFTIDF